MLSGQTTDESSYKVGKLGKDDTDDISVQLFSQEIRNLRRNRSEEKYGHKLGYNIFINYMILFFRSKVEIEQHQVKEKSPTSVKDVKDLILASSKSILGKVLSPTKEKISALATKISESQLLNDNAKPNNKSCDISNSDVVISNQTDLLDNKSDIDKNVNVNFNKQQLMTRRELTDPFGSDEEEAGESLDNTQNNQKSNDSDKDDSEANQKQVPFLIFLCFTV